MNEQISEMTNEQLGKELAGYLVEILPNDAPPILPELLCDVAMIHCVECILPEKNRADYMLTLTKIVLSWEMLPTRGENLFRIHTASGRQRAEALLAVLREKEKEK